MLNIKLVDTRGAVVLFARQIQAQMVNNNEMVYMVDRVEFPQAMVCPFDGSPRDLT